MQEEQVVPIKSENSLALPLISLGKSEIDQKVSDWLNTILEVHSAGDLYIFLKQMEEAVGLAISKLKSAAFDSFGNQMGGESSGRFLGHEVKLSYPIEWVYSQIVSELSERQKKELKAKQLEEQANGTAQKFTKDGRITITLRK